MPLLGICRGMEILNVALGGTLVQHLPDTVGGDEHRHTPGAFADHEVRLEPGSLAARAAGRRAARRQVPPPPGSGRAGGGARGQRLVGERRRGRGDRAPRPSVCARCPLASGGGGRRRRDRVAGRGREIGGGARSDRGGRARHRAGDGRGAERRRRGDRRGGGPGEGRPSRRWRAVAPGDRAALLHRLADALAERAGELATLEARNAGKPIGDARGEMGMVVDTFRYYAGAPERLLGQTIPVAGGVDMTFREPLGVVGLIVPWNFPLVIASWKVAPALAAGNTRGAEARRADAADARWSWSGSRSTPGSRRASSTWSPGGAASAAGGWWSTPTWPRSPSPARPRWGAGSPRGPRRRSSASPWSWAASRPTWCSPTPISSERPRRRRRPCSAMPARTAARARGSWWRARSWTGSWRRSARRSAPCGSAIHWTRRRRWGR